MRWILAFLWNPADALDWHDDKGKIDHAKAAGDLIVFAFATMIITVALQTRTFPPVLWGIVLVSGAMGTRVFMAFINARKSKEEDGAQT